MSQEPLMRDVSDTALWIAQYRAEESERPDAVFKDPFARRLAGERGKRIVDELPGGREHMWALVARVYAIDQLIGTQVEQGVDLVVNLAAGLDTRPYRMELPSSLKWIEVDLPEILDYKENLLKGEKPRCALERVRLDLSNDEARRGLFARLGRESKNALVVSEGLLIYLSAEQATALAQDLAAIPSFKHWIFDIASPGLMKMMVKQMGRQLDEAKAPFKFAPEEGPDYFARHGWKTKEVLSNLKVAARIKRAPFWLRLFALLPERPGPKGSQPWAGNCLLERSESPIA